MLDTSICTLAETGYPDSVEHLLTAVLLPEHVEVQTCLPFRQLSQTGKSHSKIIKMAAFSFASKKIISIELHIRNNLLQKTKGNN